MSLSNSHFFVASFYLQHRHTREKGYYKCVSTINVILHNDYYSTGNIILYYIILCALQYYYSIKNRTPEEEKRRRKQKQRMNRIASHRIVSYNLSLLSLSILAAFNQICLSPSKYSRSFGFVRSFVRFPLRRSCFSPPLILLSLPFKIK